MHVSVSPPYCWCDSRCERCPLADECAIATLERDRAVEPVLELRKTDAQLRLERHASVYDIAAGSLDLGEAASAAALVAPITARIAGWLLPNGRLDPGCAADTGPNLLLLERCMAIAIITVDQGRERLEAAAVDTFIEAHRALRRALDPLFLAVDLELRRHVADLITASRAPSPFCVA